MAKLLAWLALCLAHGASADDKIPQALDADDQCTLASCAMNALQLRAKGFEEPQGLLSLNSSEEELMEWHNNYYGREPGADISAANYRLIMSNISAQQQAILALWNRTLDLEKDVNALVQQVEHDSGLKVADYLALAQEADMSSREQSKGNQPREAHVRKWISYMSQEMGAVFRKLNSNGQQVAAAGTLMSKNPVPLKLQTQTMTSLTQSDPDPLMPGDHVGKGDELWRSVMEVITNVGTATTSANDLEDHIQKINKMIVDFNEGKLIPEEGAGM